MTTYDWIVIGGGITGSALAYELSQKKLKVLLLEKDIKPHNATVYSYGGLAYWSGTTPLTQQLGKEGIELHRHLSQELDGDTGFKEIDLLLTVNPEEDPAKVAKNFTQFARKPEIINRQEACQIEPLLNPDRISGVLKLPHGQVNAQETAVAYQQALLRNNGTIEYEKVIDLLRQKDEINGVVTPKNIYHSSNTVVCAGGLTHSLLKNADIETKTYFTHAQVIKTQPIPDIKLSTIVMPAQQQRFTLEATAKTIEDSAWETPDNKIIQSILDPGAVQLQDNSVYLGQISAISTNPELVLDNTRGEAQIRQAIAPILPKLASLPGTCHHCLVAFNTEKIAIVGEVPNLRKIYLFSGFTSTIVFAPPLAKHFADWVLGDKNSLIKQLI